MFRKKEHEIIPVLKKQYDAEFKGSIRFWGMSFMLLLISMPFSVNLISTTMLSFLAYDAILKLKSLRVDIKSRAIATSIVVALNVILYIVFSILY